MLEIALNIDPAHSQAKDLFLFEEEYQRISNVDEDLFSSKRKERILLLDAKRRKLLKVWK